MYLVPYLLKASSLTQDFILDADAKIGSIQLNLCFVNDPSGTFTMTLKQGSDTIEAVSLTMTEIISGAEWTANQHHHGHLNFQLTVPRNLKEGVTYTIELSSSGYTYNGSAYIAWIQDHENTTFPNGMGIYLWKYEGDDMKILNFFDGYTSASTPVQEESDFSIDLDGFLYWRATPDIDANGDFRFRVNSGVMEIQKYDSSAWATVENFELGA